MLDALAIAREGSGCVLVRVHRLRVSVTARPACRWPFDAGACVPAEWLNGASGPSAGAEFRGKNRHGLVRWATRPRVVAAEPGREFGFVVPDVFGHDAVRWTYQLGPAGPGTEASEVCEILRDPPFFIRWTQRWGMGVKDRRADLEANIRKTLDTLKAEAERTPAQPG